MRGKRKSEVLVVGAGPVGMFAALLLARRGVDVQVVDAEWRTAGHSYALALHPQALALLDDIGLGAEVLQRARRVESIGLYDRATRHAELRLAELPVRFPFVAVLPQMAFEQLLQQALRDHKVKVQWNHRVAELNPERHRVVATVEKLGKESGGYAAAKTEWVVERAQQVEARFVIGADGHRSRVRRATGADLRAAGEHRAYAVFEYADAARRLPDEMRVVLAEHTEDVLWPLPDGYRWSLQVPHGEIGAEERFKSRLTGSLSERFAHYLSVRQMGVLLSQRAPWFEISGELRWSVEVPFEQRLSDRFGHDAVWLAGDAAHLTGPVGVHSMNVGLREAHELAWRLTRILRGSGGSALLDDYDRQQRAEWRQLLGIDSALEVLPGAAPWVQQHARRILPCVPATGANLAALLRQIGLRFEPAPRIV